MIDEDLKQQLGEALSHVLYENAQDTTLDWCDSRNIDMILDEILPIIAAHQQKFYFTSDPQRVVLNPISTQEQS